MIYIVTMTSGRQHFAELEDGHVSAVDTIARNLRQEKPGSIDLTLHTFVRHGARFVLNVNHIESIVLSD